MTSHDELNQQLSSEASMIDVEPTAVALEQVRAGLLRRRRRSRALMGSVGALALIAGGLVAVSVLGGDSGSDSIQIAGPDTEVVDEPTTTTTVDAAVVADPDADVGAETGSETTGSAPAAPTEVEAPTAVAVNIVEQAGVSVAGPASDNNTSEWLVPWSDGFISARRDFAPPPLPDELPEEVAALFSQEVLDVFEDGLPETIDEATEMLTEAGLLDEVAAVIQEHPEASAAIYGAPQPAPDYEVSFTTDGDAWESIDFEVPAGIGDVRVVKSTGDRIAVLSQEPFVGDGPLGNVPTQDRAIFVSTTTDLINWEVVELADDKRPTDLPDVLSYSIYPQGLAINADGWVATAFGNIDIRLEVIGEMFPEVGEALQDNGNIGYGSNEQGIEVSAGPSGYDDDGTPIPPDADNRENFTFTWQELGVDPDMVAGGRSHESSLWSASWGSDPVAVDIERASNDIVAADDGFYGAGEDLAYSPDGVTWSTLTLPIETYGAQSPLPIGTGVAVIVSGDGGPSVYRVSGVDDSWEPIELAGTPDDLADSFGAGGGVWFLSPQQMPEPVSVSVDVDGYTLTQTEVFPLATVLLVDPDGNEVINETWNRRSDDDPGIIDYGVDGIDIVDPVTGDVVLTVDNAVLEAAYNEMRPPDDDSFNPDLWMLATRDGKNWIVDNIGTNPDGEFFGPGVSAINDTTVLTVSNGDWMRYDL